MPRNLIFLIGSFTLGTVFVVNAHAEPVKENPVTTPAKLTPAELEKLKTAANYSDANAQYRLGMMYLNGEAGVEKDEGKARRLLRNAALQNHVEACYELGNLIRFSKGGDGDEALKWLRLAANTGMAKAQVATGDMYVYSHKPAFAIEWYEKAAKQGNAIAQRQLGKHYFNGVGVTKDTTLAIRWWTNSAEQGDAESQFIMGSLCIQKEDAGSKATGLMWLKKSAENGNHNAARILGTTYLTGEYGVTKNHVEALKWLLRGNPVGHGSTEGLIGAAYALDEGVKQDPVEAYAWIFMSAEDSPKDEKIAEKIAMLEKALGPNLAEARARIKALRNGADPVKKQKADTPTKE